MTRRASRNRECSPASADSIESSLGQEDHVSMGTIAARKAKEIYYNVSRVVAIELFAATQAIDLNPRDAGKSLGKGTSAAYQVIREAVPVVKEDRIMYKDFEKIAELIKANTIVDAVEKAVGTLELN